MVIAHVYRTLDLKEIAPSQTHVAVEFVFHLSFLTLKGIAPRIVVEVNKIPYCIDPQLCARSD